MSNEDKSIFIHICKCGGTSIHDLLGPQEKIWRRDSANIGFAWEEEYKALSLCGAHFTIEAIRKEIDPRIFEKTFKFAVVRNPWSRLVSAYHYGSLTHARSFDHFVENINEYVWCEDFKKILKAVHALNCLDWISDDRGNVLVDFVAKIENLQGDFNIICDRMGIPRQQLPHTNKSDHKHYSEYYNDKTKQIVAERYAKDIEYFGYEFE